MELHQIRYFLAVAREQHFSRAAQSCNITQPALTRAIQKLEEEMGGLLFDRRPGRIELTELGRTLLPRFEAALNEVTEARTDAKSLLASRSRKLRLGLTCTLGPTALIGLVTELQLKIPDLELTLREGKAHDVLDLLVRDEIDAAILGLPDYGPAFDVTPLFRENYVVALPPNHRLLDRDEIDLSDLEGERYLDRLHCEFDDHFGAQHGDWPIALDVRFQSEREDWIQALIAAGLGCAIVPEYLQMRSEIGTRPLLNPSTFRDVTLVTVSDRRTTAPIAELNAIARAFQWSPGTIKT